MPSHSSDKTFLILCFNFFLWQNLEKEWLIYIYEKKPLTLSFSCYTAVSYTHCSCSSHQFHIIFTNCPRLYVWPLECSVRRVTHTSRSILMRLMKPFGEAIIRTFSTFCTRWRSLIQRRRLLVW